jgi:murein DD-endopeptidase MepM/ murein hydrolase activator NlpD
MFALTVGANAASHYGVTLAKPMKAGTQQLAAGDYKVEMQGDKAVFKMGKTVTEVPAKVENTEHKNQDTSVSTSGDTIKEIQLGGTSTKIVIQ